MANTNKVEFGVSEIHVGTYSVAADGTVTMGTPIAVPGAKSISVDPDTSTNQVYADNVKYWADSQNNGFTGTMTVMKFQDDFCKQFLGYAETADGGIGEVKNAKKPSVYIAFQSEGDAESRRVILYNVTLSGITREYSTIEENKEPVTEACGITVVGDNKTGLTKATYKPGDAGYATLFSKPSAPALKTV